MAEKFVVKQERIFEREYFDYETKESICRKSDHKCCHCGKIQYVNYGATVDHFIPLNKGGSNQFINLIMLCKDCNKSKDDKMYSMDYVPYLKEKHKQELSQYVDSYIQVIDYVQRHRLLAYDEYNYSTYITPKNLQMQPRRKNAPLGIKCSYTLKLATWDDLDRMTDYLIRYLAKNNALDNEHAARENIIFWMQFGCIYYIERQGEITVMFAMTIKHLSPGEDYRGIDNQPYMYIFPYYQTDTSDHIVTDMIYEIPRAICIENNLKLIPINIVLLEEEKMQNLLSYVYHTQPTSDNVNGFIVYHVLVGEDVLDDYTNIHKEYDELNDVERATCDFFNKFSDITDLMIKYFEKYEDRESVSWMINSILSPEFIKESELSKYVTFNEIYEDEDEDDEE